MTKARAVSDVDFHESRHRSQPYVLEAKGVGEAGCIGIPAATANAVFDALSPFGACHHDMLFTSKDLERNAIEWSLKRGPHP